MRTVNILFDFPHGGLLPAVGHETISSFLKETPIQIRSIRHRNDVILFSPQFLTAAFLMEHIMTDFWFPLESSLMALLPKIAAAEEELLKQGGWESGGIFTPLKYNGTQVVASYMLSLFFLFAVLHATRVIDLRLLTNCGPGVFAKDIGQRFNKLKKRVQKLVARRRQVKFRLNCKSSRSKSFASSHESSDFEDCDCNCPFGDTDDEDLCNDENNFEDDCIAYDRSRKY
ncbi:flavin monoamine oxidase [Holotrichia oblita]|uniref:Flavin monoamine oxidase n=1 Tax=Holotrichia oblita TaxID=644536 RepID=A0ACB9TC15_HOLOL|nr:flavin monoamine oxidase [Holotrichia oblita]